VKVEYNEPAGRSDSHRLVAGRGAGRSRSKSLPMRIGETEAKLGRPVFAISVSFRLGACPGSD